jgi:osmotically-inducible protein OsmY
MPYRPLPAIAIPFALAQALALGACDPVTIVVGGGAVAGVASAQERGIKHAANDTALKLGISDRLLKKSVDLFGKVSVTVVESRALLTGAVRSDADRDEATRVAWQADGVREVINEIQVTPDGDFADVGRDVWITTRLRGQIITDREVSDINYSIETVNGVVYLIGIAQNDAEIVRVTDHARTISGVRRVVSHVILKTDPRRQKL